MRAVVANNRIAATWLAIALAAAGLSPARAAEPEPVPPGDPRVGESLFVGAKPLQNHGAPCLGCHGISGHGLARAASFGPDLTEAYASNGAELLEVALTDVPYPSMQPLYAHAEITAPERAHLIAFLRDAGTLPPPRLGARYALEVAFGVVALGLAFVLVGRRRAWHHRSPPAHRSHP